MILCAGLKKSGKRVVGCGLRAAGWGCDAGRIGFGHRCRIAKTRVFGPDIGVESQKRVFKPMCGSPKKRQTGSGSGSGCGLGLGLRGGSNSALNGKINFSDKFLLGVLAPDPPRSL